MYTEKTLDMAFSHAICNSYNIEETDMKHLTRDERTVLIEAAIQELNAGKIVDLVDASYCSYALSIGDFRDYGMSVKNVWRTGMNWTWNGPGVINLDGTLLGPGDQSVECDMDWS
jgi:hypothetical protein